MASWVVRTDRFGRDGTPGFAESCGSGVVDNLRQLGRLCRAALLSWRPKYRRAIRVFLRCPRQFEGCIPRNADAISSMWDSVGLVHESLSAALCRNRRMRIQQIRGRGMIVTAFTSFVSIRVIRGPSFFAVVGRSPDRPTHDRPVSTHARTGDLRSQNGRVRRPAHNRGDPPTTGHSCRFA